MDSETAYRFLSSMAQAVAALARLGLLAGLYLIKTSKNAQGSEKRVFQNSGALVACSAILSAMVSVNNQTPFRMGASS